MIGGQAFFAGKAEENFILAQGETNPVEAVNETAEIGNETVFIENGASKIDLQAKFARLKKAMRKRSSSIF